MRTKKSRTSVGSKPRKDEEKLRRSNSSGAKGVRAAEGDRRSVTALAYERKRGLCTSGPKRWPCNALCRHSCGIYCIRAATNPEQVEVTKHCHRELLER